MQFQPARQQQHIARTGGAGDGAIWVAVGGVVSVDLAFRAEGKTRFAAEELTSGRKVDVVTKRPSPAQGQSF